MKMKLLILGLAIACWLNTNRSVHAADQVVRVSAAGSLGDVLKAINSDFEKKTGIKVEMNLAASNVLARQIQEGAAVDVFLSADMAKMEALEKEGLIDPATKESQLSNALVIVLPSDSALTIRSATDLAGASIKKLALGDPKAVPAGIYAKEWLTKLGQWRAIEPKVVATESVRAALVAVESGNVEAGIVYQTDASISKRVKVAFKVPATEAPQIIYPMALLKDAPHVAQGRLYLTYLDSPEAMAQFEKFGFIVLPEAPASK